MRNELATTRTEQQCTVENGSQVPHCWRKSSKCEKRLKLEVSDLEVNIEIDR
jgi:hypothetical protein